VMYKSTGEVEERRRDGGLGEASSGSTKVRRGNGVAGGGAEPGQASLVGWRPSVFTLLMREVLYRQSG
jgi:hypothetical protein